MCICVIKVSSLTLVTTKLLLPRQCNSTFLKSLYLFFVKGILWCRGRGGIIGSFWNRTTPTKELINNIKIRFLMQNNSLYLEIYPPPHNSMKFPENVKNPIIQRNVNFVGELSSRAHFKDNRNYASKISRFSFTSFKISSGWEFSVKIDVPLYNGIF